MSSETFARFDLLLARNDPITANHQHPRPIRSPASQCMRASACIVFKNRFALTLLSLYALLPEPTVEISLPTRVLSYSRPFFLLLLRRLHVLRLRTRPFNTVHIHARCRRPKNSFPDDDNVARHERPNRGPQYQQFPRNPLILFTATLHGASHHHSTRQ